MVTCCEIVTDIIRNVETKLQASTLGEGRFHPQVSFTSRKELKGTHRRLGVPQTQSGCGSEEENPSTTADN
jgi:hypothetical protein